jgi:diacylglycerol kinase (ATP)
MLCYNTCCAMEQTTTDTFVIVNPVSGGGRARRAESAVASLLAESGRLAEFARSRSAEDMREQAARAAARGFRYVVAMGGDGAFHDVVEGILGTDAVAGFFPAGNGNDIARALKIPNDPVKAAQAFLRAEPRPVDVVCARFGDGRAAHFIGAGGLGMDAVAAHLANTKYRAWPGTTRYLAGMFRAYFSQPLIPLSAEIDGVPWTGQILFAAIANGNSYGSGLRIAPDAKMDDGFMDIVMVSEVRLLRLLKAIPIVLTSGDLSGFPEVQRFRCRRIAMRTGGVARVHGDGEQMGESPVEFEVLPGAIKIMVAK